MKIPNKIFDRSASLALYHFLIAIFAIAIVVCIGGIAYEYYTKAQGQDYYSELSTRPSRPSSTPQTKSAENIENEAELELELELELDDEYDTHNSDKISGGAVVLEREWVPYVDFDAVRESIPKLVSWIHSEGTVINYPIVQGVDNEYFLYRLPNGKSNKMGSIYLDYRNAEDYSDKNTLIYGHHMKNGSMFGSLEEYKTQAYYEEHPVFTLHTPDKDYEVLIFAGYVMDPTKEIVPIEFEDTEAFMNFVTKSRKRSVFKADSVEVTEEDTLISLATCTYTFSNARFIIVGKLVEVDGKDW